MTITFVPDVGIYKAQNQKQISDMTCLVCKLQTKVLKIPIFGGAIRGHANFTKFCEL